MQGESRVDPPSGGIPLSLGCLDGKEKGQGSGGEFKLLKENSWRRKMLEPRKAPRNEKDLTRLLG